MVHLLWSRTGQGNISSFTVIAITFIWTGATKSCKWGQGYEIQQWTMCLIMAVLPISNHGFALHKGAFHDAMHTYQAIVSVAVLSINTRWFFNHWCATTNWGTLQLMYWLRSVPKLHWTTIAAYRTRLNCWEMKHGSISIMYIKEVCLRDIEARNLPLFYPIKTTPIWNVHFTECWVLSTLSCHTHILVPASHLCTLHINWCNSTHKNLRYWHRSFSPEFCSVLCYMYSYK